MIDVDRDAVAERVRLAAAYTRDGQSLTEIAVQLGVTSRAVTRYRMLARTGRPPGRPLTATHPLRLDRARKCGCEPCADAVAAGDDRAELAAYRAVRSRERVATWTPMVSTVERLYWQGWSARHAIALVDAAIGPYVNV